MGVLHSCSRWTSARGPRSCARCHRRSTHLCTLPRSSVDVEQRGIVESAGGAQNRAERRWLARTPAEEKANVQGSRDGTGPSCAKECGPSVLTRAGKGADTSDVHKRVY